MDKSQIIQIDNAMKLSDINNIKMDGRTVLDFRNYDLAGKSEELADILCELDEETNFFVILSDKSIFFDVTNRLRSKLKGCLIPKISIQKNNSSNNNIFEKLDMIESAYRVLENFQDVSKAHPIFFQQCKRKLDLQDNNDNSLQQCSRKSESYRRNIRRSAIRQIKKFHNEDPKESCSKTIYKNEVSTATTQKCYICKNTAIQSNRFCTPCLILNESMLNARTDLNGRYAIVTGGRIKIGLEVALKLLRDGCHVVVTTRFPHNAQMTYSRIYDYCQWKNRVQFKKLDLLNMSSLEAFIDWIQKEIPHLDILINNAAQTVWRPSKYYTELEEMEVKLAKNPSVQFFSHNDTSITTSTTPTTTTMYVDDLEPKLKKSKHHLMNNHTFQPSSVSIMPSLSSYTTNQILPSNVHNCNGWFPSGLISDDGQQLDLRPLNSWKIGLTEVPLSELLQVLTVNSVSPFILISRMKTLLLKSPFEQKFVVNVSAMEGQFSRITKGPHHPHTNMAKAALNMLTRTSGIEFQHDKIYMTAVDTGWCTDERPHQQAQFEKDEKGFMVPLTPVDGAARVYHPIVHGLDPKNVPYFAVFLKDYKVHPW